MYERIRKALEEAFLAGVWYGNEGHPVRQTELEAELVARDKMRELLRDDDIITKKMLRRGS